MNTIFFTHIPKTAGTSVRKTLLYPNVPPSERGSSCGLREMIRTNWSSVRWLEGHYPYGIHRYMRGLAGPPVYFTMLRDPMEQAVSFYTFIRASSTNEDGYVHPFYEDARGRSLTAFYRLPHHQNIQTRFLAGYLWHRMRDAAITSVLDQWMLRRAKDHLVNEYACFGLVERFKSSMDMFASLFGWEYELPERRIKPTRNRRSVDDLSDQEKASIRESCAMDFALYDFARAFFENQPLYDAQTSVSTSPNS